MACISTLPACSVDDFIVCITHGFAVVNDFFQTGDVGILNLANEILLHMDRDNAGGFLYDHPCYWLKT
jgi:hypothetical protein